MRVWKCHNEIHHFALVRVRYWFFFFLQTILNSYKASSSFWLSIQRTNPHLWQSHSKTMHLSPIGKGWISQLGTEGFPELSQFLLQTVSHTHAHYEPTDERKLDDKGPRSRPQLTFTSEHSPFLPAKPHPPFLIEKLALCVRNRKQFILLIFSFNCWQSFFLVWLANILGIINKQNTKNKVTLAQKFFLLVFKYFFHFIDNLGFFYLGLFSVQKEELQL